MTKSGALGAPILRFLHALNRSEKPLVAAVAGRAVGVGTTMLLHCDHVVASEDALLSTPFVALGLVPEAGSSLIAPRLMGHARAFELLVMGRPLDRHGGEAGRHRQHRGAGRRLESAALAAARKSQRCRRMRCGVAPADAWLNGADRRPDRGRGGSLPQAPRLARGEGRLRGLPEQEEVGALAPETGLVQQPQRAGEDRIRIEKPIGEPQPYQLIAISA